MKNLKSSTLIRFPVESFRKIETPYEVVNEPSKYTLEGVKSYLMIIDIKNLPDTLNEWRKINPRDPNLNSGVSKKIDATLRDCPDTFLFKNRGITLLAHQVRFDNKSKIVEVEFVSKDKHGLLDGGHTFVVIKKFLENIEEEELKGVNAFLKIEIMEGIEERESVVSVVEARNTSIQVKEQSIQELKKLYSLIKTTLNKKKYSSRISYKEHELLEDGSKKDIDIKEILSYLICFDAEEYDNKQHPIKAYSTKSSVLDHYKKHHERMQKYISLLPDILELHDYIYSFLPEAYNSTGGKFGALTGVIEVSNKKRLQRISLPFSSSQSSYRIPSGFIYPVLASFRNLVDYSGNKCKWTEDPFKFFDEFKAEISTRVCEQAKELRNPNKLGKDNAAWRGCYDVVQLEVLKKRMK